MSEHQALIDTATRQLEKAADALAALDEAWQLRPGGRTDDLRRAGERTYDLLLRLSRRA